MNWSSLCFLPRIILFKDYVILFFSISLVAVAVRLLSVSLCGLPSYFLYVFLAAG